MSIILGKVAPLSYGSACTGYVCNAAAYLICSTTTFNCACNKTMVYNFTSNMCGKNLIIILHFYYYTYSLLSYFCVFLNKS